MTWSWDPTVVLGTLALGAGYAWLIRDRGRSRGWSPTARLWFSLGLLALILALESPIDVGGDHYLFSLHMVQHLVLAMVVPPLLLLGLPQGWLTLERVRVSPITASIVFNLVLALWHLPFLYETTLRNGPIHVLEHLSFLLAGALFWWPIMASSARRRGLTVIGKIAYLAVAGVPPTILGLAFILSRSVLYPFYASAPRVTPLSPLDDQVAAGLVMFGLGNLIYFLAIAIMFFRLDDRGATAGDPAPVGLERPHATMR